MVLADYLRRENWSELTSSDLNREVVVKDLQKLVVLITEEELATIALIVLFNLCNDFGLFQHRCNSWLLAH